CQTDIIWENKEENFKKAEKYISEAAQNGAGLIVFPEMSFTGFTMNTEETGEVFETSETLSRVKNMAEKNKIAVGFGMTVKEKEKNFNRFALVDKSGKLLGFYDKIHPFSYSGETNFFTGGERLFTTEICGVRISCFVCYDLRFPEIFSAAADDSDLIIVIANWPSSRINQWSYLLRARAVENQCYVAGINRTGEGGGIVYNGRTSLFDSFGSLIAERDSAPGITYTEINPEEVSRCRTGFRMRPDRREDLYIKLFKDKNMKKG
ncbi:MAG: carbon-nitrogen family hydrolase, partial [Clostridiales bacterium]|nr:carbon-nitrogen family hydrolase [Clostridiales bacterium]